MDLRLLINKKRAPFWVLFFSLISDFLFLAVDFVRPLGFKILRQELSDALQFMRRSAPLNYEPCLSQGDLLVCKLTK